MKKIFSDTNILLILVISLLIVIMNSTFKLPKEKANYELHKVGYIKNTPKVTLIKDHNELLDYISKYTNKTYDEKGNIKETTTDKIKKKYNKKYFENYNLAIYYIETNSGSITIKNINPIIDNNELKLEYKLVKPEVGTMDMNGYMIVVELNKKITIIE